MPTSCYTLPMQHWQQELAQAAITPLALCETLELNPNQLNKALLKSPTFPLRVPHAFINRMKKGDPRDPLLLQVLPLTDEHLAQPGYSQDPLNEKSSNPIPGLLHKYHGRVLLTLTGACAVHCRYCFRRHFPYKDNQTHSDNRNRILEYICKDSSIKEVILSGGDPLVLKDAQLAELTSQLAQINHVKTLRIHTRLPIVIPNRITADLITALTTTRLKPIIVLHCNHAQEIDQHVEKAINILRRNQITVLNQSVLLKSINDDAETLITLSERLFDADALPYYLHLLDPVSGSAHFDVPEKKAIALIQMMQNRLPGYCVPKLVREIAGAQSKIPVR